MCRKHHQSVSHRLLRSYCSKIQWNKSIKQWYKEFSMNGCVGLVIGSHTCFAPKALLKYSFIEMECFRYCSSNFSYCIIIFCPFPDSFGIFMWLFFLYNVLSIPFAIPYFCFQFPLYLSLFFFSKGFGLNSTNMWKYTLPYYINNIYPSEKAVTKHLGWNDSQCSVF